MQTLRTKLLVLAIAFAGWLFPIAALADDAIGNSAVQVAQNDYSAFIGTWEGKSPKGSAIKLIVPDDVADGGKVRYWWKGEEQWAYTPHLQGDTIKLTNASGNDLFIGPVDGDKLSYKWVEKGGGNTMDATLTRD